MPLDELDDGAKLADSPGKRKGLGCLEYQGR
jgi:hypothetical protein